MSFPKQCGIRNRNDKNGKREGCHPHSGGGGDVSPFWDVPSSVR